MTSAKITRCKHYFHGVCLRKWLYVQDRCPLCHEIIMHHEPSPNEKQVDTVEGNRPAAGGGGGAVGASVGTGNGGGTGLAFHNAAGVSI